MSAGPLQSRHQSRLCRLQQNSGRAVRDAFNNSMMISDTRSANQSDQIELTNTIVLGVAFGCLTICALLVIVPAVFQVMKSKQAIFDVFIQVPVDIIRALRMRLAQRILAIRRAQEDADAGIDLAGAGDELNDDEVDRQFQLTTARSGGPGGTSEVPGGSEAGANNAIAALRKAEQDLDLAVATCRNRSNTASGAMDRMHDDMDEDDGENGRWCRCIGMRGEVAASNKVTGGKGGKGRRHYGQQASATTIMLFAMLWPIAVYLG